MFKANIKEEAGVYSCVVCSEEIFSSKEKYESGSGWPSFYDVISADRVVLIEDKKYGP